METGDLPNPGIEPRSLVLQADSLPAEPQGKPKNIGVGSLSLLPDPGTHSSILGEIPWTEKPGGLQSKGSQRVGHD